MGFLGMTSKAEDDYMKDAKSRGMTDSQAQEQYKAYHQANYDKLSGWDKFKSTLASNDVINTLMPFTNFMDDPAEEDQEDDSNKALSQERGDVATYGDDQEAGMGGGAGGEAGSGLVLGKPAAMKEEPALEDQPEEMQTNQSFDF